MRLRVISWYVLSSTGWLIARKDTVPPTGVESKALLDDVVEQTEDPGRPFLFREDPFFAFTTEPRRSVRGRTAQ